MIIKFALDPDLHASLIAKIKARAGKNSVHKAALAMIVEWSYFEDRSKTDRKLTETGSVFDQKGELEEINLSGLDKLDLNF